VFLVAAGEARTAALMSDPPPAFGIDYSTYLGGSATDRIFAVAVGPDGSIYVAGSSESFDLFGHDAPRYPATDGFVARLAPDGSAILASAAITGAGDLDYAQAIAVRDGTVYVVGATNSSDLLTTPDAFQPELHGEFDAFLLALSADDLRTLYATYLGGAGRDSGRDVVVGTSGAVFVTGLALSADFPTGPGGAGCRSDGDAFILRFDPSGRSIDFGVCMGGSGNDFSAGLALDESQAAVVLVGSTTSTDLPLEQPLQTRFGGGETDAFVAVLDDQSGAVRFASYWGGSDNDRAAGVAVDGTGAAYVTGSSWSADLPFTDPLGAAPGNLQAFVSRFALRRNQPVAVEFSRYLGGRAVFSDDVYDVAVDAAGNAVVVGVTTSADFPLRHAVQPNHGGGIDDAFVTVLERERGELLFSTFLGGGAYDSARAVAVAGDDIYVGGLTGSADFPLVGAVQGTWLGSDAFLTRIAPREVPDVCLYAAGRFQDSVAVFDTARRRSVGTIEGILEHSVAALAVAPDGERLYVAEQEPFLVPLGAGGGATQAVAVLNTRNGELEGSFGELSGPTDLFVSADGTKVYVGDRTGLVQFDAMTGQSLATAPVPDGVRRISVDPASSTAYLLARNARHVHAVDLTVPTVERDLPVGDGSLVSDLAVLPGEGILVVVEPSRSRLTAHDPETGAVRWNLPLGAFARVVTASPDERLLFVGHGAGMLPGAVTVVDVSARSVVALLSFEFGVDDIAVTPDGAFLYVSSAAAARVAVVDTASLRIVRHVELGWPAEELAIGPGRNGCRVEFTCTGDCDGSRGVSIEELISAVAISLGTAEPSTCASLAGVGEITIDILIGAVRFSLEGCPGLPLGG
jgi:DNA-binding beta-propeller fold protein YncE